jgi:hypothetical protein
VVTATASGVLADGAVITVGAGLVALVRQLWPDRRKVAGPLAVVLTGLGALALAVTGKHLPYVVARGMLAGVVVGWLVVIARRRWSRLRTGDWSALISRRKKPAAANHVYIWVDSVSSAAVTAFIVRENLAACAVAAIGGLLVPIVGTVRLGRKRSGSTVALWTDTRRATPPWPGMNEEPRTRRL